MTAEAVPTPDWMKSEPVDIVADSGQSESSPSSNVVIRDCRNYDLKDGIRPTGSI